MLLYLKALTNAWNLAGIPDNYPKYVVTMDQIQPRNTYKGIRQAHLKEFLIGDV